MERMADISWPRCSDCLAVECLFHSGCSLGCTHMRSKIFPLFAHSHRSIRVSLPLSLTSSFSFEAPTNQLSHLLLL